MRSIVASAYGRPEVGGSRSTPSARSVPRFTRRFTDSAACNPPVRGIVLPKDTSSAADVASLCARLERVDRDPAAQHHVRAIERMLDRAEQKCLQLPKAA